MKYSIAIAVTLLSIVSTSAFAGKNKVCKCRISGGYIEEGKTACLKTPDGFSLARCVKVLNNTSWERLNQPCPTANLTPKNSIDRNQTPFPLEKMAALTAKN